MKQNIGQKLAFYPTPATVVGTVGEGGKTNWLLVAHVRIVSHSKLSHLVVHLPHDYQHLHGGIRLSGQDSYSLCDIRRQQHQESLCRLESRIPQAQLERRETLESCLKG